MTVYDFLLENEFINEISSYEHEIIEFNQNGSLLDFLNKKGFTIEHIQNRLGLDDRIVYDYAKDSLAGTVKIIFIKDLSNQLHLKFECKKPEV